MMRTIFSLVLSVAMAASARAQEYEQLSRKCYENSTPDQTIEACSTVIASGRVEKEDLATAFKNRGNAYDSKGQYDRAIEDYDHAIAINPNDADALNNRGISHRANGHYDLAVKDYDQVLKLTPYSAKALNNRCFAKALMDQLEQGLADVGDVHAVVVPQRPQQGEEQEDDDRGRPRPRFSPVCRIRGRGVGRERQLPPRLGPDAAPSDHRGLRAGPPRREPAHLRRP